MLRGLKLNLVDTPKIMPLTPLDLAKNKLNSNKRNLQKMKNKK